MWQLINPTNNPELDREIEDFQYYRLPAKTRELYRQKPEAPDEWAGNPPADPMNAIPYAPVGDIPVAFDAPKADPPPADTPAFGGFGGGGFGGGGAGGDWNDAPTTTSDTGSFDSGSSGDAGGSD